MPANIVPPRGLLTPVAGLAALGAWSMAFLQALPRLTAGPLCSARSDVLSLAGHCPACFVALGLTLVFLLSLKRQATPALQAIRRLQR